MARALNSAESAHAARWWRALPTSPGSTARLACELCPRECELEDGQRGACYVRRNVGGRMLLTTYGRAAGVRITPIESLPLYHFHPGSSVLSFGTAGCNLECSFCANGDRAHAPEIDRQAGAARPEGIASAAQAYGAAAVAFTDNEPVVFAEYAIDTALACRARAIKTVALSAGYVQPAAAREFYAAIDAVRVELKGYGDVNYARRCGGRLRSVLDTLSLIRYETRCWLELGGVLIPGDDSADEVGALAGWIVRELGAGIPLHLRAIAPDAIGYASRTALARARRRAQDAGLQHVYSHQPYDSEGGSTFCPNCQALLIEREGDVIVQSELGADARCPYCRSPIAGYFERLEVAAGAGRRPLRIPIRFARR